VNSLFGLEKIPSRCVGIVRDPFATGWHVAQVIFVFLLAQGGFVELIFDLVFELNLVKLFCFEAVLGLEGLSFFGFGMGRNLEGGSEGFLLVFL
jgi:hypothetical protein